MMINRTCALVLPASMKYIVDDVITRHNLAMLLPIAAAISLALGVQGASEFLFTRLLGRGGHRVIADLRCKVRAHIGRLPLTFYDNTQTGGLVARIMNDVEGIRNLLAVALFDFIGSLLTTLLAVVILIEFSAGLALAAIALIVMQALWGSKLMSILRPIEFNRAEATGEVIGRLTESLSGIRVVKGYRAEEREEAVFRDGIERVVQTEFRSIGTLAVANAAQQLLTGASAILVLFVGARQVLAGTLTVGELMTFTFLLALIVAPINQMGAIVNNMTEALTGIERTRDVLKERTEDNDGRRRVAVSRARGEVTFEDVSFSFEKRANVIRGVSFSAEPGTTTALVGPSGAGKSTIVSLIAGFHVPEKGIIRIDGLDLSTLTLDSYRRQLGLVFQDTFLFNGTIRDNVAFSRPDASEAEIMAACRIAHVDEFAERFRDGYESIVGEKGIKLSGGQKQRISIARAILADPTILLFDEATSSLDSQSEALIQDGLRSLSDGRTTFIIAHRLSTVRRADQILFVERGAIVERGTHESLLAMRGRYYEVCRNQYNIGLELLDTRVG